MIRIFIKNKRFLLRNFRVKDINKEYLNWFSGKNEDLKFSRHYKKKYNKTSLIKNYNNFVKSKNIFLGIFENNTNELIGTITIYLNDKEKSGNLGIFIGNKKYNSKGFALESCSLVIDYLMKKKIVKSIITGTKNENLNMIRLMKKLKMKKIRRRDSKNTNYIINKFI